MILRLPENADVTDGRRAVAEAHRALRALEAGIQRISHERQALMFHVGGIATELRRTLQTCATLVCE